MSRPTCLSLYDPGGLLTPRPLPPHNNFCPHAFNFEARPYIIMCVGNFPKKLFYTVCQKNWAGSEDFAVGKSQNFKLT